MANRKKTVKKKPPKPAPSMAARFTPLTDEQGEKALRSAEKALHAAGVTEFIVSIRLTDNNMATQMEGRRNYLHAAARALTKKLNEGDEDHLDQLMVALKKVAERPPEHLNGPTPSLLRRLLGKRPKAGCHA